MVKIDAKTVGVLIHPWLVKWERTYYETENHPFYQETGYKIQWQNIRRDFKGAFELPRLVPKLAYSFGLLFLALYKTHGIPFEVLLAGAVAFDNESSYAHSVHPATETTVSVAHTAAGANRIASIAVCSYTIGAGDTISATGVTYGGNAATQVVVNATPGTVEGQLAMFKYIAPATSEQTVEVTFSAGVHTDWIAVSTFTGADQTTQNGDFDSVSGSHELSITLDSTNGDMVSDVLCAGSDGYARVTATGTNQTIDSEPGIVGWNLMATSHTPCVGVSTTSSWHTSDNAFMDMVGWVILQAAAAGPAHLKKISGVAVANVKKIAGVAIANVKKVAGVA